MRIRRGPLLILALAVLVPLGLILASAVAVWQAAHNDEARRIDRVDVIAVLGAAMYGREPSPTFQGRLEHAALLYRRGFAPRLLVLGGKQPGDEATEADTGRSWLISNGLPESAVSAEPEGNTTFESLRAAADFMRDEDLQTVMLVSDPWHNLRVRRMARDLGLDAYVSATWQSAARSQWKRLGGYARETFAYLYYRVIGR
ncbi:MAG TPA: YdcF family protein [Actinomycetota bacterium]|nr:YdcF family protein [Actinomycetota bacterium]